MTKKTKTKSTILKSVGKKPTVPKHIIFDVLKDMEIFTSDDKLKTASNSVWDEACTILENKLLKQSLYLCIHHNRNHIKTDLLNYKNTKAALSSAETNAKESVAQQPKKVIVDQNLINKFDNDVLDSLHLLHSNVEYNPVIKEICLKPFHIIYFWPEQIHLWKIFIKLNLPIFLAVTTDFVGKVQIYNHTSDDIILYTLMSEIDNHLVSFFQVISEKKHKVFIIYILSEWLRCQIPSPQSLVIPLSLILLEAAITVFNNSSLTDYVKQCFDYIRHKVTVPPLCTIHFDVFNIIYYIEASNYFCEKMNSVKEFYIRCILYISTIHEFDAFEKIIHNLLTLMQSECRNELIDQIRTDLISKITNNDIEVLMNSYKNNDCRNIKCFDTNEIMSHCSSIEMHEYIKNLCKESLKSCSNYDGTITSAPNPYYINNNFEEFINLLTFFPMWTKLIYYELKSSFCYLQKKYFCSLNDFISTSSFQKNETSVNNTFMRADDFLIQHAQFLKILGQEAREITSGKKNSQNKIKKSIKTVHSYLDIKENWMGKGGAKDDNVENLMETDSLNDLSNQKEASIGAEIFQDLSLSTSNCDITKDHNRYCLNTDDTSIPNIISNTQDLNIDKSKQNGCFSKPTSAVHNMPSRLENSLETDISLDTNAISCSTPTSISKLTKLTTDVSSINKIEQKEPQTSTNIAPNSNSLSQHPNSEIKKDTCKKPTKYLSAFKEIEEYYSKPQKTMFKNNLIENGNKNFFKHKNTTYIYESTSVFDSISEIFLRALKNHVKFNEYCMEEIQKYNNIFLKSIIDYRATGDIKNFYKDRCDLFLKYGVLSKDTITCRDDLSLFLSKLMNQSWSFKQSINCNNCCNENYHHYYTTVPVTSIGQEQLVNLQSYLKYINNTELQQCTNCKKEITPSLQFSNYIAIDMESEKELYNISEIPDRIIVQKKEFILSGIIRVIPARTNSTLKHYTTYCRSITGFWKTYNNIGKRTVIKKKVLA